MNRRRHLALLTVVALAGCGGSDRASVQTARESVTPAPAADTPTPAPTATATATATATPAPAATATPNTGGTAPDGGGGDEEGIHVPLGVDVSDDRIVATPDTVDAFLPLRVTVRSTASSEVTVVVMQAGDGDVVARLEVAPGAVATADAKGLKPGTAEILSPDLDPDATAVVHVVRAR